jgi:hypothetical protein
MLWHILALDLAHLDTKQRSALEHELNRLAEIPEVLWFRQGRDVERPHITAFVCVIAGTGALARYRVDPTHVEVAAAIRRSGAAVQRLDMAGLPVPA